MNTLREVLARVNRTTRKEWLGECWEWSMSRTSHNYGQVHFRGEMIVVHRLIAGLLLGDVTGMCVRHLCDNPPCCNPAHLMIGTMAENQQDRVDRKPPISLTVFDVEEIRRAAASGETYASIARRLGRNMQTVYATAVGRLHKRLPGPISGRPGVVGENQPTSKLTVDRVIKIRELAASGMMQTEIAKLFNVSAACVNAVVARRNWKHVG